MNNIHEVHKQLSFLTDSIKDFRGGFKRNKDLEAKKEDEQIVPQDIFLKIVSVIGKCFEETDEFLTISQLAKFVWKRGIRPQVNPEQFVECIIKAVDQFDLEFENNPEGIKYRRKQ